MYICFWRYFFFDEISSNMLLIVGNLSITADKNANFDLKVKAPVFYFLYIVFGKFLCKVLLIVTNGFWVLRFS